MTENDLGGWRCDSFGCLVWNPHDAVACINCRLPKSARLIAQLRDAGVMPRELGIGVAWFHCATNLPKNLR